MGSFLLMIIGFLQLKLYRRINKEFKNIELIAKVSEIHAPLIPRRGTFWQIKVLKVLLRGDATEYP